MHGLTIEEFNRTQTYLEFMRDQLAEIGLTLSLHGDLERWRDVLRSAPKTHALSKTLDPEFHDIRPGEAFWLSFDLPDGAPIACAGGRVFEARDFFNEYITTQLIFFDREPKLDLKPLELVGKPPRLAGRVGFAGGSWVHPDWRGHNLAGATSRIGRVIALRFLRIDYYTAFIQATPNRTAWLARELSWPHHRYLMTGHHPGRDNFEADVNLCWTTKRQILEICKERLPLLNEQRSRQIA